MKLRNVLTMLGTAAVTAVLTLALLAPRGSVQAGPAVQPVIAQPQLTSHGCTFSLKTDKTAYEAGEKPVVEVTASNPTDKPVSASVWVTVTATAPTSRMSRMLAMPRVLWSHEYAFTLPADGTKSLTADCEALPAGQNVAILLSDQQNSILAGGIGTPNPAAPVAGGPNAPQSNAATARP